MSLILTVLLTFGISAKDAKKEEKKVKDSSSLCMGLAVEVPDPPVPVRAAGKNNLVYELHISNLDAEPVTLEGIEIRGDDVNGKPLQIYEPKDFKQMIRGFLKNPPPETKKGEIKPGERTVAFLWVELDPSDHVPQVLNHRVLFKKGNDPKAKRTVLNAPRVQMNKKAAVVIKPPLKGDRWVALEGPVNIDGYSHHRFGVITVNGKPRVPQRYAVDWIKINPGGKFYHEDVKKNENWYCYGEEIYSVADGTVVEALDGIPENVPMSPKRAVEINFETVCGNYALVKNDNGTHALYAHMIPGSVQVKVGDRVKAGRVLGRLGNSGNSDAPHLHFHISDTPQGHVLAAEGFPYVFDLFFKQGEAPIPYPDENINDMNQVIIKMNKDGEEVELKDEMPLGVEVYKLP